MSSSQEGFDVFLTDNGSLRPDATFGLRRLAADLGERLGRTVRPVSLLHAHKIPAESLEGAPATILKRALRHRYREGGRNFVVLPLFLGPSRALSGYVPEVIDSLRDECPGMEVRMAEALAGRDPDRPDQRLAEIMVDGIRATASANGLKGAKVAIVDHGTPEPAVNRVREAVVDQVRGILGAETPAVVGCAMERREGPEYAFNDPLLENLYTVDGFETGDLILSMFFLLPGRHAGAGGDVAEICETLQGQRNSGDLYQTGLMADDRRIIEILADRFHEVVSDDPRIASPDPPVPD